MKTIAVLGADKNLLTYYKQAKELGYKIIGIATPDGAVCKAYCDKFYPVSFAEKDKVVEICKKEEVDGILSFSLESAIPVVSYVAEKLGLIANSVESSKITATKFSQREALRKANIPVPQYFLVSNENDLPKLNINYPVIVKPSDSGGSQGVSKVDTSKELNIAFLKAYHFSKSNQVIIEEYIDGREFSVEYLSYKGMHHFIQVTDKETSGAPNFVELAHHQPAQIDEDVKLKIKQMVEAALSALKIENSASHTEIKLNSHNELYIIETGARLGGDFITSHLVKLSTGYDMVEGLLNLVVGDFKVPEPENISYSGVYFYTRLTPEIGQYILNNKDNAQIKEWSHSAMILPEVKSNFDRGGYFIYQNKAEKIKI